MFFLGYNSFGAGRFGEDKHRTCLIFKKLQQNQHVTIILAQKNN